MAQMAFQSHGAAALEGQLRGHDLTLVKLLCFWTPDDAQVARVFQGSELGKRQSITADYLQQIVAQMRAEQECLYDPAKNPAFYGPHHGGAQGRPRLCNSRGVETTTRRE